MKIFTVYYRGTANIAAERVCTSSAKSAVSVASGLTGTPAAYLRAERAKPWADTELPKLEAAFAAIARSVKL